MREAGATKVQAGVRAISVVLVGVGVQQITDAREDAIPLFSKLFVFRVVGLSGNAPCEIVQVAKVK